MKTVSALQMVPFNALRVDAQVGGAWLVYEPGDVLPTQPPTPPQRIVTAQEFRDRFTQTELLGMLASADSGLRMLLLKIQTNSAGIDLLSSEVQQGLTYLVSKSLIVAGRPAQITG